ncbi:hypothetical protein CJF32_00004532 [Rutstroemia sp. NJR-2017a WRK4]|nr:hypothetical protein CJF32_00004532 [Rutstroemia sp. NJR-2017a WRK4]
MSFPHFPSLPTEIRIQIWRLTLSPRIIRWHNTSEHNHFSSPALRTPLLRINHESRATAFTYGKYITLQPDPDSPPFYFSPHLDWLLFDPTWFERAPLHGRGPSTAQEKRERSMNSILPGLEAVQNLMVHPNWSGVRVRPLVLFGSLPSVKNVLVAVDEKSIGLQSKVLMESTWDIRSYYQSQPGTPLPYIAVGCLGWMGDDRWRLHRGERDTRELIRVLESYATMHTHKKELESERRRFIEQRVDDTLIRNLRPPVVIPSSSKTQDSPSGPAPPLAILSNAQDSPSGSALLPAQDAPSGPAVPPVYWDVLRNEPHAEAGNEPHVEGGNEPHGESNSTNQAPSEGPAEARKKGLGLNWKEFVEWCRENEEKGQTSTNA